MKQFLLVLIPLAVFGVWCEAAAAAASSCEPIKISMCKALPYNLTHFPNALFHYTQTRANESINQFAQVVRSPCSSHLVFFLCVFHLPICAGEFSKPILPCRSLCEKVKADCTDALNKLKLPWPSQAQCDKLPSYDRGVCVQPSSFVPPEKCPHPPCTKFRVNYHSFIKYNYNFVMKGRLVAVGKSGDKRVLKVRVLRAWQKGTVALKKRVVVDIVNNSTCNCDKVQKLRVRGEYFIMGHEQQGKLVLADSGVIETWSRKWPKHYAKWVVRRDKAHTKGSHTHNSKPSSLKKIKN